MRSTSSVDTGTSLLPKEEDSGSIREVIDKSLREQGTGFTRKVEKLVFRKGVVGINSTYRIN